MKFTIGLITAGAALALALYFANRPSPPEKAAVQVPEPKPAPIAETPAPQPTPAPPAEKPTATMAAKTAEEPPQLQQLSPFGSQDELLTQISEADLLRAGEMERIVEMLKRSENQQMGQYFLEGLKLAGQQDPSQRNRLVLVADSWRGTGLLPMWQNLVMRETPRQAEESAAIFSEEPTETSRSIMLEMTTAISNLGIMASQDKGALNTLRQIVEQPNPQIHSPYIRERAYYALREANVSLANRLLRGLSEGDELRSRLTQGR